MKYNYVPIILFLVISILATSTTLNAQLTVDAPSGFELNDDTVTEGLKCTDLFTTFSESSFIVTDDCPGDPVIDISSNTVTTGCFQTYTVTVVVSNDCGESQTWEADFDRIDENQNPVLLDIPADFEEFFDSTPTVLACTDPFPTYTVADFTEVQGCGFIRNAVVNETPFANGCFESLYITYTVEDECLNVRQFAAQYDRPVNPLAPPTITTALTEFLDGAATLDFTSCDAVLPPAITETDFTATVAGDAACSSNVTTSLDFKAPTNDGCVETFIVEYIATDACENSDTLTATYTRPFNDGNAPDVTLPVGYEVGFFDVDSDNSISQLTCLEVAPVFTEANFTVDSNCALYPATGTLVVDNESTNCDEITTYTYTAQDICGNSIIYQAIFNAKKPETVPPVIIEGADDFEETADGVDTNPVLLNCNDAFPDVTDFNESDFLYGDGCTPNSALILGFTTSGEVDNGCYLEETFTFTAEDLCGNINDSWVSTYIKPKPTDVTPPTITFNTVYEPIFASGADPETLVTCTEAFPEFTDADFSAEDDCIVFPIDVLIESEQEFSDDGCTETLTVTISAVDYCDNHVMFDAVFVRFVNNGDVIVNVPAGFEQNDDTTIDDLGCDATFASYTIADFSAGNTCDAGIVVNNVTEDLVTIGCVEYQTITYTIEDYCGNTAIYVGKFSRHITDNIAPVVVAPAGFVAGTIDPTATIIQGCGVDFPVFVEADFTPTDNCGIASVEINSADETSVDSCFETRTFTYTATDTCGLSTTYTGAFTILADNTTPPTVVSPNSPINAGITDFVEGTATAINLENCGDALPTYDVATFNVTDDCGLLKSVVLDTLDETSSCFNTRTFTLTAIDTCDNAISYQAIYNSIIDDNLPPTIVAPSDFENGVTDATPTVINCGETPSFTIDDFDETNGCGEEINEALAPVVTTNDGCLETLTFTYTAEDECGDIANYTADFQQPLNELEVEFIEPTSICPDGTYTVQALGGFGCAGGDFNVVLYNALNDVVVDNTTGLGATNITFTGVTPGIYYVVVTDNTNGCEIQSITKTVFGLLDGEFTPSCGATNNTFTINNLSGGSDNYNVVSDIDGVLDNAVSGNYQPSQTLTAGVHTITITDNAIGTACELIFTIEVFDELVLEAGPEDCSFNGTVNVTTATGGASGYTIFPSTSPAPNATNNITSNETSLTAIGTFTGITSTSDFYIILEDGDGCQVSQLISVVALPELTNELTFNCANTNQASVAVTGGTAPWNFYLYETGTAFDNGTSATATLSGGTSANFTGVTGGAYTVYAVDDNGCESSSVNVDVFDELALEIDFVSCNFNGEIEITAVLGGAAPYTITLSNNGANETSLSDVGTFTGVAVGAFDVIIEDDNGCEFTVPVDISNTGTLVNNTANCAFNTIAVAIDGGVSNYDFYVYPQGTAFDDGASALATNAQGDFTDVAAGTYTIYATDANGCEIAPIDVTVADEINLEIDFVSCNFNGEIEVTSVTGGTAPYTIILSNNGANEASLSGVGTFTGIAVGAFDVVIEDDNGCQFIVPVDIGSTGTLVNNTADCAFNTITVTIDGGVSNYDFYVYPQGIAFDDGVSALATNTQGDFADVAAGTYTVYATDANGCEIAPIDVTVADELTLEIDFVSCNFNGEIEVTSVAGGTAPYTITLSNNGANEASLSDVGTFTGVAAGVFDVVVEDDNGCQFTVPVDINSTGELVNNTADCAFNAINVAVDGGVSNYDFYVYPQGTAFDDGASAITSLTGGTTANFTDIDSGDYTIYATANDGCDELTIDVYVFDEIIAEQTDLCDYGTITVTASGGFSTNYTYSISGGAAPDNTTGVFENISAGSYTVTVSDDNPNGDCPATLSVQTFEPINVEADQICYEGITVTGGQPGYTYDLYETDGTTLVGSNTTGVFADTGGDYILIVTDANGCDNAPGAPITCEPEAVCDLEYTTTSTCVDGNTFTVEITLTAGTGNWLITDGINPPIIGASAGDVITTQAYPNGNYAITITSQTDPTCTFEITGSEDCTPYNCELDLTENIVCNADGSFTVDIIFGGEGTFTIDEINGTQQTDATSGAYTFGPYTAGITYGITVTSNEDDTCTGTIGDTPYCCSLNAVANAVCVDESTYTVNFTIDGEGTFIVDDGNGTVQNGVSAGEFTTAALPNGSYTITITSEDDPTCSQTLNVENDCFECDVEATATATCEDAFNYNLEINITGSGTYIVDDGINTPTTGVTAGTFAVGILPNGAYNVIITSEVDADCSTTVSGTEDCFECDVEVSATTNCIDGLNYELSYTITGTGTFTVDDGINPIQTGVTAGTFVAGTLPNGAYNITVTNEFDDTCTATTAGEEDCFECPFPIDFEVNCLDDFTFEVVFTYEGEGTFSMGDGINPVQTGLDAAVYTVGPFNNGDYNIVLTSEVDPDCVQTISGTKDCFECDLEVTTTSECVDILNYELTYTIVGTGAFTVNDGVNPAQNGVVAGTYTVGTLPNGPFSIVVTSETDPDCSETINGEQDCFECELDFQSSTVCNEDGLGFEVTYIITGADTYVVEDGVNATQTNVGAGTYTVSYPNGAYAIVITSETKDACSQTISGSEDCFECDLEVSASAECIDFFNYNLGYTITGTGTFTINDGINPAQTGIVAGTYTVGTLPNGAYSILITSETDPDCSETLSGEQDCFECELDFVSNTICNEDGLGFEVTYTITGSDTYIVEDGVNGTQTNIGAGTYSVSYPNGAYSILITSETNAECTQTISGNEDCFECDLEVSASAECIDFFNYNLGYTIAGTGTFTVNDGINPVQTGVVAGTYAVGTLANGAYSIVITSETDPDCSETLAGEQDCFECELDFVSNTVCNDDGLGFEVTYTITGSDTYIIEDGVNGTQTNISAGIYTVGYPNGGYSIVITSETNAECTQTISGEEDCFECELNISPSTECNEDGTGYTVTYSLEGTDTYIIEDGVNGTQTNVVAGTYTVAYPNGGYSIVITSETDADCTQTLSGEEDCFDCGLEVTSTTNCINEDSYNVFVNILGNGTFTVNDGINTPLTGVSSGNQILGPFVNGAYNITVTSETDPTCVETLSGSEDCSEPPVCDVTASATTVCQGDEGYEIVLSLNGTGTFTVNDGINPPLTNQSSAAITLGPIPNGAYSITITSELDATCTIQLTGNRDCAPEIPCDISAIASTNCVNTESYELVVDLTGSSTYTLTAGTNTITGATSGSISIGTLPTGAYSLTITDETDVECTVTLSGNEDCTQDVDCDVTVEAIVQCISNQQYIVSITINGNSTYVIDDQQGGVSTGLGNGTYEIGPFPSNTAYQIEVLDEANDLCFKTVSGSKVCEPGLGCDPGIVIDKQCLPDNLGYQLEVTLSGSSTYSLYDGLFAEFPGNNLLTTGLQAGDTFIIGPFDNSEQYSFLMLDEEDELCFQDYIGTFDCLGGCDLEAAAFPICNDDGTFNVEITVEGSGTYDVTGDVFEPVNGGETVSYGPYNAGDTYYFLLIDQFDYNCIQDFLGTADCEAQQPCDINASVDFSCFDNETYDIIFNLSGEGVFTITASNGTALTNITQADNPINLGNFTNGGYTINIQDENNIECNAVYVGSHICQPPPPCDLVVTNNNVCVDTGNYNVELSVTGSDVYDIYSNGSLVLSDVSSGTYSVGPIPNGDYDIVVQGAEDITCLQTIQGNFSCSDELPCDVVVTVDRECLEEGEYQLNLTVTGSGTYTISDGNTIYTTTQTAGVITVGPFANGSYNLEVIDNANDECFQNISGSFECVTCDLAANFIPECTQTGGFVLQLNLTGSSSYTITNNGNIIATDISAGQQEIGPIASGFYSITIQDENNASCSQTSEGTFTCEPSACDIAATLTPTCINGNVFDMELVLTGSSIYTITGGFDTGTLTGQTAGTIDLIGMQGGGYSITIQDEIDGTCFQTYNGVFECEEEPCDLFVSSSIECEGEDFFIITLNISGSGLYEVFLFGDLINADITGIVELGPFEVNDIEEYELTITGQNTNCEQTITVEPDCSTEPAVCNLSLNAQPICNDNGSYYFELDLPAGTTYSVTYGPPGGGGPPPITGIDAGVYTTIDFTTDFYGFTVTAENIADCSQQVFGTYGCSVGEPGDPECDISFSYTYECLPPDGETYNFIITIVGEGLFNVITTTAGGGCNQDSPLLLEVPAGTYVVGPSSENGCPNETVLEQIGTDCTRELFATASCTPDCLMDVFMEVECNVDGTFDVVIDIEGDDTYNIQTWDGQDLGLNGVDPGTYTVGPFTSDYDLVVFVEDFDACFYRDYKDDIECEDVTPPPCDLDATVAYTCNEDGTYFVDLFIIDGSGTYDFVIPNGGPGNPPTILGEDLGTGQHNFGPFNVDGEENLYVLTQVENINCEKLFYLSPACQADCDLSAFFLRECNDDGTFNVIVNISGSGNYSILNWPDQSIGLDNVAAGLYTAGPYEDEYDILVVDVDNPEDCFFNDFGEFTECGDPPPICNVFTSVAIECNDDGSFFLEFSISGSDVYDIIPNAFGPGGGNNDIDFEDVFDLSAGVYTFGPFTGTAYDLLVLGSDFEPGGPGQGPPDGCFQLVSSEVDCTGEPVPCDLSISINDISCNNNNGLVELEITGTDTYTVEVEGEGTQSGVSAGIITIPVSVPNINITVTAQSNPSCFETLAGSNPCVSSICDLVAGASVECLDNGDYNVIVDITGSGTYTVTNDFGEEAITDVTAGSITFGPLDVPTYQITITKDGDEECFQTITGNDQCNPVIPCDLNATTDIYCNEDGTYSIDVTITGSDIYDIYRSGTGELGTGFMLEFTTDDWPQEVFWNLINDATGEVVYSTSPGSYPTPFENYTEVMDELDPDVNYTIILFDTYGDGWTLGYGGGNFSITDLATGNIIEDSIFEDGEEFEIFLGSPTSSGNSGGGDEPIIANATVGTYTVGPFTNNVYDFTIISQSDPSCALEFTGNYSCNLGNCSVSAEYTIECAEDGSGYFVLLQVRGNGSYTITDDVNPDLTNQNAGLITVGPIPNGIFDIKIFDPSNPDECYLAIGGTKNCGGGIPCDLDVQVELGCTATGIPIVTADVTITGSSVYTLDDGQGNISNGLTAGVYTINLGDSSVNYNIIVTDEAEDDCNQTVSGFYTCVEPPICNINASLSFECIDDLTFNTNLSITGSSTYRIEYNGQTLNNITSDVSLGIFNNGSYTVLITDEANPSCTQTLQGNYACSAISFCDLSVAYEANCTNGDLFIDVTISGSGTYYIQDSSGFGEPIVLASGLTAGTVTVGPLAIDFDFLSMQVFNESNQDCFQNISGASSCEDGCDLFISAATECVSSTAYNIILTITGNSTYNLSDQLGNPYNGYMAGTYTFGPYTGSNYNFNVTSDDGFFCSQFISGVRECTVPNICDLNVDIAPICDDASPNSFFIDLTLSGSSSYSVIYSDGFGSTQISGLTAGNTQIGPINDGFYNIQIVDETNSECTDFYNGNYNCGESQECDLTISAVPVCNEDGSYNLEVTVEGSDTYNIFDFFTGVFLENVGAGTYEIGPLFEDFYQIGAENSGGGGFFGCSQFVSGNFNCDGDCDLNIDQEVVCNDDGTFNVEITITGGSNYEIIDFFTGESLSDIEEGTYTFGPYDFQSYFIFVSDLDGGCSQEISGQGSCSETGGCNLFASQTVECIDGENGYNVTLEVTGSGTYDITDIFGNLVDSNVTAGTYTYGPFYLANYQFTIFQNDDPFFNCFQQISGVFECSPPGPCDLIVSALPKLRKCRFR